MAAKVVSGKLGPLPVWGWAAIGVGVFVVWRWWQNHQSGSSSAPPLNATGQTTPDDTALLESALAQISWLGAGNSGLVNSPAMSPGNTQTGATNQTQPAVTVRKPKPVQIIGANRLTGKRGIVRGI